ncbi:hypothetical protein BYT27DRAFT_7106663 [Phlegmacium glaucopus]|nr:hypothetical protein BYT27DRAFT_7106663 [Phlegmacium glaucopus]
MASSQAINDIVLDEDAPGPPISVPDSGDTGEGGKLKMIVQLVKKSLGVKDLAAMRLSLPASLLEPVPNLEYWHYLDRPDYFAAINDFEDPFMRMLSVLRFTFTKEAKFVVAFVSFYIHGKVCKPYNSVLGEHFRAHWDVVPSVYAVDKLPSADSQPEPYTSESASLKSGRSSKSGVSSFSKPKSPSTAATSLDETNAAAQFSNLNLSSDTTKDTDDSVRVVFLCEQVSHHPPVSAYFATCPSRSIEMSGIDQIAAKISGTTLRVAPGQLNQGIFINLTGGYGKGERYQITHPVASVNGILRGSFYVTVGETTIITCQGGKPGTKFRTIIEYKEESWLGRAHFLLEGVIHTVFESDDTQCSEWTKIKQVPPHRIVATFDGTWRGRIRWKRVGSCSYPSRSSNISNISRSTASSPSPSHTRLSTPSISGTSCSPTPVSYSTSRLSTRTGDTVAEDEWMTLLDLSTLHVVPKVVRPLAKQDPRESRKLWENVTNNLLKKEYSEATKEKIEIEQRQRDEAAERKRKGAPFIPRYFVQDYDDGYAALTAEGVAAVKEELKEDTAYSIEGVDLKPTLTA